MPPTSASSARRGRRLLAAVLSALSLAAAAATLTSPATRAANPADPVPARSARASSTPTLRILPTATATPTCDGSSSDNSACPTPDPTPSPTYVVVSPVPDSPSPSPTLPSYLQGTEPSPSPKIGDTASSPVPLGGGFVDQLPTPSSATVAPTGTLTPHSSGLPLPFLAVGALLILGALGSLIYAVAPRDKKVFAAPRSRPSSPVTFTPYGPDSPSSNILSGAQSPAKPKRP